MKNITLMPNPFRDRSFTITLDTIAVLKESGANVKVCLPFRIDRSFEIPSSLRLVTMEEAFRECEALVCLGGDGTILHAARLIGHRDIPMLGINTGNMGFMAELDSNELDMLPRLVNGSYTIDQRMMLHIAVKRDGRIIYEENALNDAVITKGTIARVIQLSVSSDDNNAMRFDGDGIILSTPTGSTAYSYSAGGPVVDPGARNIVVTPICAHGLANRSLILPKERTVSVSIGRIGKRNAFLCVDGGKAFRLVADDQVIATCSKRNVKLLKLKNTNFFDILNRKFGGSQL